MGEHSHVAPWRVRDLSLTGGALTVFLGGFSGAFLGFRGGAVSRCGEGRLGGGFDCAGRRSGCLTACAREKKDGKGVRRGAVLSLISQSARFFCWIILVKYLKISSLTKHYYIFSTVFLRLLLFQAIC